MGCGPDMAILGERTAMEASPNIKLFGQTISVSAHTGAGADAEVLIPSSASPFPDAAPTFRQDWTEKMGVVETPDSARSSSGEGHSQPSRFGKLVTESRLSEDSSEGGHSDELKEQSDSHSDKSLPKPDKVVACPRCHSLDTKFCYYNNYNVNQPRHFCKNCQRYWTAGGTLRNVPVGAGRRKNKHSGGMQQPRESCGEPSASPLFSGSPTSQKGSSFKPKRVAGQSSPVSASSFGQESGMTMSSPPYSLPLHHSGRLPFQPYASSQGFMTSGSEVSVVGSSDSASTRHRRLQGFPSVHGFDKDCSRSSLSVLMLDANASQQESSATYRPVVSSDMTSDGPGRYFSGDYPYGYHLESNGGPFSTALRSWSSAQWTSGVGYASHWPGAQEQQMVSLGKRGSSDGGSQLPAKALRTDEVSRSLKSTWPMLGRSQSDVNATLKLFQPKLELAAACEQKDSFMGKLLINSAAARPGPFPVTT